MRILSKTTHQQKTLAAKSISIQLAITNLVRRHGLLISLCLLSVIAITGILLPGWASNAGAPRSASQSISEQLKASQAPLLRRKAPLSTTNILLGSRRDYPGDVSHLNLDYLGVLALATHWRSEGITWSDLLRYVTRSNALAANAVFASITVTTTADTIDAAANCASVTLASLPGPGGQTSLREAICAANSNPGADTITFSVNGTFALTGAANDDNGNSGDFDIKQSLTINGNGAANTILDGSGIERIFDVFPSAASTFDLSNLTIQNGDTRLTSFQQGGAIYLHNNVTSTFNSIQVINNFSGSNGAIDNIGNLTINNSVISNNQTIPTSGSTVGGGIRNGGVLTIDNTTISNNTVRGEGGGITINSATGVVVNITNSTISGNTASITGGGLGNGGGISTTGNQGTINLTNSTISGNRADANGGGAAFVSVSGGAVTLTNVTITNNTADNDNNGSGAGGGFSQGGTTTVTLRNTIVAGNFNSTAATRDDISGAVVNTSSYNLIGDGTGMSGITNGANNNQVGSGASPINPLLGSLANNGGSTQTHALLTGSPAIDTGSNALAPATDQRGMARPGGVAADIGAYEVSDTVPPDTTITGTPPNPSNSSSATFTFIGTDNVTPPGSMTFQCQLDGGAFSACTSPRTYTGLADGSHTFQVRAVDAAGNTDPTPASYAWIVDATPPNTTITANPTNPSASTTAGFSFTGNDGSGTGVASFQCQLDGGGFSTCTSPQTYTGLSQGSHTFQVRAVDGAGNVDPSPASFTWVIDTVVPDTTITANPTNPSASANASFSFTGSDPGGSGVASFQCQLDGGGFSACTSPQTYNNLSDGSHTFQVRAIDAASNTDPTPASYTWVVNTTVADLVIDKRHSGNFTQGQTGAQYTIEVRNSGTGSTSGAVTVVDTLPAGLTATAMSGSGWNCTLATLTCTRSDALATSSSYPDIILTVNVASNAPPSVTNSAAVSGGGEQNTGNNSDSDPTTVLETTPPDTTITGNPTNPSNSTSATFTFTGSDNVTAPGSLTFQCQLDGGGFSACTSPRTYAGLADGSHTFQVRAIDGAGNVDPTPASFTWVIDTVAPDTTITVNPTDPSASPNAGFSFTGSDPGGSGVASFQCQLDGGGFSACTSPQPYAGLADGSHTFQVRAVDAAGNTDSTPASYTWLIDTVAPDTTITANPPNPSGSTSASFSFTGSDSGGSGVASFQCQLDGGAFSACTSPQTYAGLADGSHTFQVRAIDGAGKADITPASFTWVIDTVAPDTTITANPTNPSASANASFSFTGNDGSGSGVASFQCQLDGSGFSACASPQTYTGLSDGSHTFQVRAVDAAGNTDSTPASFTWIIDTTGPDTTITANPTNPSNSANASFSFTGSDGSGSGVASFQCQIDGGGFSACASPQTYTGLSQGSHTFQVRAIDAAGNTDSTPASYTWVIDTIAPDTTITANPTNPSASANASFSFTGNDGSGSGVASFQCQLDGSGFSACASPQTYTGLSDGSHTFQVRAVDAAGNTDSTPASFTWIIDTTPPDTTITANPPNPSGSTSASFSFTGNDGSGTGVASFQCQLDGGGFSACTSPQNYTGLSQGSHTFQVRAIDNLGNIDPTPASYTWSTNSLPTIMAVATSRTEGSPVSNSQIATVNDIEDAEDQLVVTVNGASSAMSGGIKISNIVVSSAGIVTADVVADCGAVTTDFTLRVTDTVGGGNETILKVTVDPNTPPTLTYTASVAASLGQTLTVNPATGPADNGPNLVLAVESISAGFTGTASVASNGRVTINNAGPLGTHTFTIKATDNCGEMTQTSFMLTVFPFIVQLSDPLICTDNGTTLAVHAEVTNPNAVAANLNFSATIPAPMSGVANTCVSSAGTCTLTANNVTVTGLIAPNQTVTIDYKVAVANGTPQGTQLCIDSTASFNGGPVAMVQACTQLNCPAGGVVQANAQKTGSVLVFPYYNSQSATQSDTRMTISNVGNVTANVHVFFIAGASCEAANLFICLTPRASFSFKASEYDPETTGWLLAVAVDDQGRPIRNNVLVGNGFVREGSYLGNYGAESFAARSGAVAAFPNNNTATLFFDGSSYDAVPDQFAVELQSPQEVPGQRLVTVGLRGDLTASQMSGAGQVGTGLLVNGNESPMSSFVSFLNGKCQAQAILTGTTPRVAGGVNTLIPPGQVGTMRWQIGAGVGLLMTPRGANGWSGIRNLHKTRATTSAITIPVFPPVC